MPNLSRATFLRRAAGATIGFVGVARGLISPGLGSANFVECGDPSKIYCRQTHLGCCCNCNDYLCAFYDCFDSRTLGYCYSYEYPLHPDPNCIAV